MLTDLVRLVSRSQTHPTASEGKGLATRDYGPTARKKKKESQLMPHRKCQNAEINNYYTIYTPITRVSDLRIYIYQYNRPPTPNLTWPMAVKP